MPFPRLRAAFAILTLAAGTAAPAADPAPAVRELISRADLRYPAPPARSEDGLPVGNGRMGGGGFVDVDLGLAGGPDFAPDGGPQHLAVYAPSIRPTTF